MRSRFSEDSLVGSTTRASTTSSSAAVSLGAAPPVASAASGAAAEVEAERTAVREGPREERGSRGANPRGKAAEGQRRGEERTGR